MVRGKQQQQMNNFAKLGAAERLKQIDAERADILRMFPELRSPKRRQSLANRAGIQQRRTVSAAARRAMSEGMRKFWARRKSGQKKD